MGRVSSNKIKEINRTAENYQQRVEDLYDEMVWHLTTKLNLCESIVRKVLESDEYV